jgi:hypothetical protein
MSPVHLVDLLERQAAGLANEEVDVGVLGEDHDTGEDEEDEGANRGGDARGEERDLRAEKSSVRGGTAGGTGREYARGSTRASLQPFRARRLSHEGVSGSFRRGTPTGAIEERV